MWPTKHITADDLDAFHSEALSNEMRLHLETCDQCQRLVATDRELLSLLGRLEPLEPRAGFEDRVMARVSVGGARSVPILSFPKLTRPRLVAMTALAAGLVASVAWSAVNRSLLQSWLTGLSRGLVATGWTWLRAAGANLTEQPWFDLVRDTLGSPGRVAVTVVVFLAVYAVGLLALRRLITPSVEAASGASA
jgi:hypothetical protein